MSGKSIYLVSFVIPVLILTSNTQAIEPMADAYIRASVYGDNNYGDIVRLMIKNAYGGSYDRKVYIRFEITGTASEASLDLMVSLNDEGDGGTTPQTFTVEVYGLAESLDHTWTENEITWNNAPANNTSNHNFTADAKFLGSFVVDRIPVGDTVSFSDPALVDFINEDTDNQITLMLRRTFGPTGHNLGFASKENTSGYSAPNLNTVVATRAFGPKPTDGAMIGDIWAELTWRPGEFAVSHDVYFNDNFDDVNEGADGAFQGSQFGTSYIVGLPGFPFPEGLIPGMNYYWRIDEVNDADPNSPWKGPVWSFRIQPNEAYDPIPADEAMFVPPDVTLTWTGGFGSKLHIVYFGDNFDEVSSAVTGIRRTDTTFSPDSLEYNKTYYWRVDEMNPPLTFKGEVWSFTTTLENLGTAVMDRWESLDGFSLDILKADPNYPDNPDVSETVTQFAWNGPDLDWYGARIEAWLYVRETGDYTFWLNSDDNGELWLSTDEDPSNGILIATESTHTSLNYWGSGEEQSDPITLEAGQKYYISALWKEGYGYDHCQVAWQGPGFPERTIIPGNYLAPFKPIAAFGARPSNQAVNVTQMAVLKWKPGLEAVSHEVYFGTDEEAVRNATTTSPEYQGSRALGDEVFDPGKLPWETTYFWRIDEINDLNPDSPWTGDVWTFTTASFLIVDDFEGYTDDDTTGGAIWQHWIDGFGVSANGSQVGYVSPPFAEHKIVHGGRQSMPLSYNNTDGVTNSEAELTLGWPRDWTEGGVTTMSIWFHGRPASVGSFKEEPTGKFMVTGSGRNISLQDDEFHFAYKKLTGPGTIIARVDSVQGTDEWAKAGVMIRETLEAGSKHAFAGITPGNGVVFRARVETDGSTVSHTQEEIAAPHWVKVSRDKNNNFTIYHSPDGSTWVPVKGSGSEIVPMRKTVYIGLAVTAADEDLTCEGVFSEVTISGDVDGQWINHDIGIASNIAEPIYVSVSNAAGPAAVVTYHDADAALVEEWTQWKFELSRFSDLGIDLRDVDRVAVGFGVKGDPAATGGKGVVFFDNIWLLPPSPVNQP